MTLSPYQIRRGVIHSLIVDLSINENYGEGSQSATALRNLSGKM